MSNHLSKKAYRQLAEGLVKLKTAHALFSQPNSVFLIVAATGDDVFVSRDSIPYRKLDKRTEVDNLETVIADIRKLLGQ